MKKVTAYQTEDGALFTTPKWAAKHEESLATVREEEKLRKAFKKLVIDSTWFFDESIHSQEQQDIIYDDVVQFLMDSRKDLKEILKK